MVTSLRDLYSHIEKIITLFYENSNKTYELVKKHSNPGSPKYIAVEYTEQEFIKSLEPYSDKQNIKKVARLLSKKLEKLKGSNKELIAQIDLYKITLEDIISSLKKLAIEQAKFDALRLFHNANSYLDLSCYIDLESSEPLRTIKEYLKESDTISFRIFYKNLKVLKIAMNRKELDSAAFSSSLRNILDASDACLFEYTQDKHSNSIEFDSSHYFNRIDKRFKLDEALLDFEINSLLDSSNIRDEVHND